MRKISPSFAIYLMSLAFFGFIQFQFTHASSLNRVIAATPLKKQKAKAQIQQQPHTAATTKTEGQLLWDYWYTVTVGGDFHYEYYNDHAEIREGRIVFLNRAWKLEENYINEEQAGAFAQNNDWLTPLFFNFHSNYRSTETFIDGNVKENNELTVKARKGNREFPLIKRQIPPHTFFSLLFPVWLGKHLNEFKVGVVQSFGSILEDQIDSNYSRVVGQVRLENPDEFAQKTRTSKLSLNYQDVKSTWYVEPNGAPLKIIMPAQQAIVERTTQEIAERFLNQ